MKKITPLITVDEIEAVIPFWTAVGLEVTVTVPHGEGLGFAMLNAGALELMYQSRASVEEDLAKKADGHPGLAARMAEGQSTLFIEVESIDELLPRLGDVEVVVSRRRTFYGMDEIFVLAPCGTLVGFAAKVDPDA